MATRKYRLGPETEYVYTATLLKIVDGDTYDFVIHWQRDIGFRITVKQEHTIRTRAYGINTPETNKPATKEAGMAAKAFVQQWFNGNDCIVKTYRDEGDKYGRYLAEVWDTTMTVCLNRDLVTTGHAVPYYP